MKTTLRLFCSFFLLLPGAYAIIRWTVMDYKSYSNDPVMRAKQYLSVFPAMGFGFSALIVALLILSVAGTIVSLSPVRGGESRKKIFRILLVTAGSIEAGMLLFSLM